MDNIHVTMREKSNFPQHSIKFHMQIISWKMTKQNMLQVTRDHGKKRVFYASTKKFMT